jgi:type IV pilus assembly protein PilA
MSKYNQGFTLIELMMVVAIIGILAALALPAYQDYTKRAHIEEGLTLAADAKLAIAEYYATNGKFPVDNNAAGLPLGTTINGEAVKSIIVNYSRVEITYNTKILNNTMLYIQGYINNSSIQWTCNQGTVPMAYRPASCR